MASVAGLFAGSLGSSVYSSSKHAVEAFSSCLRMELKLFNITVTTLNPSSHDTGMVSNTAVIFRQVWSELDRKVRDQYGEGKKSMFNFYYTRIKTRYR